MLKLMLAAVMIIGLSTISPPSEGPSTQNGHFTAASSYHSASGATSEETPGHEPGLPGKGIPLIAGLLPVQQPQAVGAASSGYSSPGNEAVQTPAEAPAVPAQSSAAAPEEAPVAPVDPPATALEETPAPEEAVEEDEASTLTFRVINGLDLAADRETVTEFFGEPLAIEPDPWTPGMEEYQYEHMTVGLYEQQIDHLIVPVSAGQVRIGDVTAALDMEQLQQLLGEPDFTAEDGLVYIQEGVCIKLFYEADGTELSTLQVYWAAHV